MPNSEFTVRPPIRLRLLTTTHTPVTHHFSFFSAIIWLALQRYAYGKERSCGQYSVCGLGLSGSCRANLHLFAATSHRHGSQSIWVRSFGKRRTRTSHSDAQFFLLLPIQAPAPFHCYSACFRTGLGVMRCARSARPFSSSTCCSSCSSAP